MYTKGTLKYCFPIISETLRTSYDCSMTLVVIIYMNYININYIKNHLKSSYAAIYFSMYCLLSTHYASFIWSIKALNLHFYYSNGNWKLQTWKAVLKILYTLKFSVWFSKPATSKFLNHIMKYQSFRKKRKVYFALSYLLLFSTFSVRFLANIPLWTSLSCTKRT